jgi:SET domain-containing protein
VARPTRFSIQVGRDVHLDPISDRESPWGCLNHGCDPNVAIDVERRAIIARRGIVAGDQLRFDYNTTEWELAEPFVCNCGSPACVGVAMGFAQLSFTRQQILLRDAAPHIRALHAARLSVVDRELQPVALAAWRSDHRRNRRAGRHRPA